MKKNLKFFISIVIVFITVVNLSAVTYHVNASQSDDSSDELSRATSNQNIQATVNLAATNVVDSKEIVHRDSKIEIVVILHGLNRTSRSMKKMAKWLTREGYTVLNCNYPSSKKSIAELAEGVYKEILPHIVRADAVHFVTHSMGGIVLRAMAQAHPLENMGRVVMLAPPNQGSEIVDSLGKWQVYKWINGPAGLELGIVSNNSTPLKLGTPTFQLGVIAGDRTLNPFLSWIVPGADDGKVAVERTKLVGMKDFICMHVTHTWMMQNSHVIRQTVYFLKTGHFETLKNIED